MKFDEDETNPLLVRDGQGEGNGNRMYTVSDHLPQVELASHEDGANYFTESSKHILIDDNHCKDSLVSSDNEMNISVEANNKTSAGIRILGVVLVIMAGMSFTGGNVIQKFVAPEVTFWQLLFIRALVQVTLTGATCLIMHHKYGSGIPFVL